jgi:hypothetical protein
MMRDVTGEGEGEDGGTGLGLVMGEGDADVDVSRVASRNLPPIDVYGETGSTEA